MLNAVSGGDMAHPTKVLQATGEGTPHGKCRVRVEQQYQCWQYPCWQTGMEVKGAPLPAVPKALGHRAAGMAC